MGSSTVWVGTVTTVIGMSLTLLGGCTTVTGRTFGQYAGDRATTARVKTRLATERAQTLTRVNVDTYEGTVYLSGMVRDQQERQRLGQLAAINGHPVVNNLRVIGESRTAAATSRRERHEATSASPATEQAGRHTVTGDVTSVDHGAGKLSLRTDPGPMDLYFPPDSIRDVKQGDRVTVSLGLQRASH